MTMVSDVMDGGEQVSGGKKRRWCGEEGWKRREKREEKMGQCGFDKTACTLYI